MHVPVNVNKQNGNAGW